MWRDVDCDRRSGMNGILVRCWEMSGLAAKKRLRSSITVTVGPLPGSERSSWTQNRQLDEHTFAYRGRSNCYMLPSTL